MSTPLIKILESKNTIFSNSNRPWYLFIVDHIRLIKSNSKRVTLNIDDLALYRYRPNHLLKLRYDIEEEDVWVVLFLNNIKQSEGIPYHIVDMFIPSTNYLELLKEKFKSHIALVSK